MILNYFTVVNSNSPPAEKNRTKSEKQKGKKEGGLGEGIFALLRFKLERFRFSLIKRNPKQKIFQILLKEKNGGRKKLKKCIEKISVLVRRSEAEASGNAPTELPRSPSVRLSSEPPRTRSVRQSGFCSKKVRISTKRYRQIYPRAIVTPQISLAPASRNASAAADSVEPVVVTSSTNSHQRLFGSEAVAANACAILSWRSCVGSFVCVQVARRRRNNVLANGIPVACDKKCAISAL